MIVSRLTKELRFLRLQVTTRVRVPDETFEKVTADSSLAHGKEQKSFKCDQFIWSDPPTSMKNA